MVKTDLSGEWLASLREAGAPLPAGFDTRIMLPGTTALSGLGKENTDACAGYLTERFPFSGRLWLQRDFTLAGARGKTVLLTLERTRITRVFLDGQEAGGGDSLCAPHLFVLPPMEDGRHTLTISVDNTGYPTAGGHMTSPDTQTNWNGITGEISLTAGRTLTVQPRVRTEDRLLTVSCRVYGDTGVPFTARIEGWTEEYPGVLTGDSVTFRIPLTDDIPRWDDRHPNLVSILLRAGEEQTSFRTGLRILSREGRSLRVNGRDVFLRGRHDGLQFPLTGCAPWDKASWREALGKAKEYGLNHIRFHTCCPPRAAFEVADEMGMYLSPELPFWGTVPEKGQEPDGGREQKYLREEGLRILAAFGAHPSFLCLSLGNELWGSRQRLDENIRLFRAFDPGRLYSAGANNFQFAVEKQPEEDLFVGVRLGENRLLRGSYAACDAPLGHIQTEMPGSAWDYDDLILNGACRETKASGRLQIQRGTEAVLVDAGTGDAYVPDIPVITHEVGQYEVYPDFSEIPAYTGVLSPRNLSLIRDRMAEKGLLHLAGRYRRASGRLAADCYRMEIEAALKSRELCGFQLLDLMDYMGQGTALVGMLDGLMRDKGLISPAEWRRFCGPRAVLARFSSFVFRAGEEIPFRAVLSDTDGAAPDESVCCELLRDGQIADSRTLSFVRGSGRVRETETSVFAPVRTGTPEKLTARFRLPDGTENSYPLWVFPPAEAEITRAGIRVPEGFVPFVRDPGEEQGPAIAVPAPEGKLPAEYCGDFWCYPMFRSISEHMGKPVPTGTMGLLIDPESPLLRRFPTEEYTTPPWYPLLRHAHAEPVSLKETLTVEMIDHWARMERLGLIWRKGKTVFCTVRLWEIPDEPAAGWLAAALAGAALEDV